MAMIRCSCGFFYDDGKYGTCPKCSGAYRAGISEAGVWKLGRITSGTRMEGVGAEAFFHVGEENLVAGWLVCVKGAQRGRDFRLFPGFNRLGRHSVSDICLEDAQVAREGHCAVVYEPRRREFFLTPGKGTTTLLNGKRLEMPERLEAGDSVGVGGSLLIFVPFCGKERAWETL